MIRANCDFSKMLLLMKFGEKKEMEKSFEDVFMKFPLHF